MEPVFGRQLKEFRLRRNLTLREFCRRTEFDAGNVSRVERGLMPPPQSPQTIEKWAEVLDLSREETVGFLDNAAIDAGRIPDRFLEDEELARRLPLVFRTAAEKNLDEEKLRELAEAIRKL